MHLSAIDGLFVQVVQVSRRVGLAKLGHVSLDGTKVAANSSKTSAGPGTGDELRAHGG